MSEWPSTDGPTVLPEGSSALIVDKAGQLYLATPKMDGATEVPRMLLFLTACMIKARDPEWVEEMIEEFKSWT